MKKILSILAVISFQTIAISTTHAFFKDVPETHEHSKAIHALYDQKVIEGYSDNTFKPDEHVSRAEALKIILKSVYNDIPTSVDESKFPDISAKDWVASYANFGKEKNIVNGYPDGKYKASALINSAEILKVATRTYTISTTTMYKEEDYKKNFPTVSLKEWFLPYILYAKEKNLGLYSAPGSNPTRGEMAEIIYRLKTTYAFDLPTFNEADIDLYNSVMTSLGISPESITGRQTIAVQTEDMKKDTPVTPTVSTDTALPITPTSTPTTTALSPVLAIKVDTPLTIIESSPFLSGTNAPLAQPVIPSDTLDDADNGKLLKIINGLMFEGDMLALTWTTNLTIDKEMLSIMQSQLTSLRAEITATKTVIINDTNKSKETKKKIRKTISEAKATITELYAKTYGAIIKGADDAKNVLPMLEKYADLPAYKEIEAKQEEIMKAQKITLADTNMPQCGVDESLIFEDTMDNFHTIVKLLTEQDALYLKLVKQVAKKDEVVKEDTSNDKEDVKTDEKDMKKAEMSLEVKKK